MTPGKGKRRGLLALCLFGTLLFAMLGAWQVQRLAWKRDLVSRVEQRIHAEPEPVPARSEWSGLDSRDIEYRRVLAHGVLLHDRETLVDALTVRGAGFWVLTPLLTPDGMILVNRGFVPRDKRDAGSRASGQVTGPLTLTGLLRLTEPGGRLLRDNRPDADLWYSRDVAAIASKRGLEEVAPFFIDAEASAVPADGPAGGMTVVHFRNAHLAYAATWFALAGLCILGVVMVGRPPR